MRFSIIKADRGYDPTASRRVRMVTVDGSMAANCVTADDQEGFALCLTHDPINGGFLKEADTGEYVLSRYAGKVEILLASADPLKWDPKRRGEAKVAVGRAPNGDVLVQVYSNARPGAIKQITMHRVNLPSGAAAVCQKAGACGGYAAELLAEQFRDTIDPSAAAAEATRQCAIMLRAEG